MFNPTREQVRRFFCDAWKKHLDRLPLVGAEVTAADIAQRHPEYHALLADADAAVNKDWVPEGGEMNPFLHLSLHLAIAEQINDRPRKGLGVRSPLAVYRELLINSPQHSTEIH